MSKPPAPLETMSISHFKATCLAVLERVRRTGRRVSITRRGKPVAEVVPPSPASVSSDWIGALAGSARFTGDIVAPVVGSGEWDTAAR